MRGSLSLTPAPVYFSLKMSELRVCFHAGARVRALRHYPVLPRSSQTVTGKKAIAWDSATGGEGMSAGVSLIAGAILAESRDSEGSPAPVSPRPPHC